MASPSSPDQALATPTKSPRSLLVRDAVVFQMKLVVGGAAGVVLAPLALVSALVGLVVSGHPGRYFYPVLRAGRQLENWIGLYANADGDTRRAAPGPGLDLLVARVEGAIASRPDRR